MLFRQRFLDGIRAGAVTLSFRRWRRPSVRSGGTLLTPIGQLEIRSVSPVTTAAITAADAKRAGYDSRQALLAELASRSEGAVYRIELGALRADPRVALRATAADPATREALHLELERINARSAEGPWTQQVLALIAAHPGVRAGDLCERVHQPRDRFKQNVRRLKALGLTESLDTGYRLSPRGVALLDALRGRSARRGARKAAVVASRPARPHRNGS